MNIQQKLTAFAFEKAYPYIMARPEIAARRRAFSVLLVGSAATGLCTERSDVDICLLCDQKTYMELADGKRWLEGRPTEVILDGTQLHYYAVSSDTLYQKVRDLDDVTFYVYKNAVVMDDACGRYRELSERICGESIQILRLQKALDMLGRRRRALHQVLREQPDPITRIDLAAELLKRLIKCIALYDRCEFDARKRLYQTALLGPTGKLLKPEVDHMLTLLGRISDAGDLAAANAFLDCFEQCYARITA